jgi:hypothetical protein
MLTFIAIMVFIARSSKIHWVLTLALPRIVFPKTKSRMLEVSLTSNGHNRIKLRYLCLGITFFHDGMASEASSEWN